MLKNIQVAVSNKVTTMCGTLVLAAQGLKGAGIAWETSFRGHHFDLFNAITAVGIALGLGAAKDGHK